MRTVGPVECPRYHCPELGHDRSRLSDIGQPRAAGATIPTGQAAGRGDFGGMDFVGLIAVVLAATSAAGGSSPASASLTKNPSFEGDVSGWSGEGSKLSAVADAAAPDGEQVVEVAWDGSGDAYGIDDSPDTLGADPGNLGPSKAGYRYTGSARVAGSAASEGRDVEVVVRELTPDGEIVDSASSSIPLSPGRFRPVSVTYEAVQTGNVIDVGLHRTSDLADGESFLADAVALSSASPPSEAGSTLGGLAIGTDQSAALAEEEGSRFGYVVLQDTARDEVDQLRAQNPDTKFLVYKNVGFIRADERDKSCTDDPYQASGVSYCDADPHEDWFLHDASTGERAEHCRYATLGANVGSPGYQERWLSNVLERLRDAEGGGSGVEWDGVYMDDVNIEPACQIEAEEYSSPEYTQAVQDFIAKVGPEIQKAGFVVMPNVGLQTSDPLQRDVARDIALHVSVYQREHFVRYHDNREEVFTAGSPAGDWVDELTLMAEIGEVGTPFAAAVFGEEAEVDVQRYARATFLLGWDGKAGSGVAYRPDGTGNPFLADWTTDVGEPTGPAVPEGVGWRRDFTNGAVVVNPAPESPQDFSLEGTYRLPEGECADSVMLEPAEALVLEAC